MPSEFLSQLHRGAEETLTPAKRDTSAPGLIRLAGPVSVPNYFVSFVTVEKDMRSRGKHHTMLVAIFWYRRLTTRLH